MEHLGSGAHKPQFSANPYQWEGRHVQFLITINRFRLSTDHNLTDESETTMLLMYCRVANFLAEVEDRHPQSSSNFSEWLVSLLSRPSKSFHSEVAQINFNSPASSSLIDLEKYDDHPEYPMAIELLSKAYPGIDGHSNPRLVRSYHRHGVVFQPITTRQVHNCYVFFMATTPNLLAGRIRYLYSLVGKNGVEECLAAVEPFKELAGEDVKLDPYRDEDFQVAGRLYAEETAQVVIIPVGAIAYHAAHRPFCLMGTNIRTVHMLPLSKARPDDIAVLPFLDAHWLFLFA